MKPDFRLLKSSQVGDGPHIVLVPGLPGDAQARSEAVFIQSAAFGFLESCLCECWPPYASHAVRRENPVPVAAWQEFAARIGSLSAALLSAQAMNDVSGLGFVMPELRVAAQQGFVQLKQELPLLIADLLAWLDKTMPRCAVITVVCLG